MLVRDGRTQSQPNRAQSIGRARPRSHSLRTQLGVCLLDSHLWDLQDTGREQALLDGARTVHLCQRVLSARAIGLDLNARTALETEGGGRVGLRCTQRREEGAITGCQPLPGRGHSRAAPSQVFILYLLGTREEEEPCLGRAAPLAPSSLPADQGRAAPLYLLFCSVSLGLGGRETISGARCRQD